MELRHATDFAELIGLLKASRRRGQSAFSYNQLAERLTFRSPRSIAMVHKRQRAPSLAMIRKICEYLKVSAEEREFILWLAEKSKLQIAGLPFAQVEERIEKFRHSRRRTISSPDWPGVTVAMEDDTPEPIRRKVEELFGKHL